MNFLPTENIIYKTKLKEEEIIRRLSESIEQENNFRFNVFGSSSAKPYIGQIIGQTFKIKRIIYYTNSFLPQISGVINNDFDGLTIKVEMNLSIFVIVFLFIWYGVVGFNFISSLTQELFNPDFFISLGMLLFVYVLMIGGFKYESNKSKKDLVNIFQADLTEE